jgi:hypothetical protein
MPSFVLCFALRIPNVCVVAARLYLLNPVDESATKSKSKFADILNPGHLGCLRFVGF